MTSSDPPSHGPGDAEETRRAPADDGEDALRRLEQRLDRASEAAERLVSEAAQSAGRAGARLGATPPRLGATPPSGWQAPESEDGRAPGAGELELFAQILASLRELIPPDLAQRLAEAFRELLLALRALLDWYLERLERRRSQPSEVQDIPIL